MDYKKLLEDIRAFLSNCECVRYGELIGAPWPYNHDGPMVYTEPEDILLDQAATAITDLLARAEAAEKEVEWKNKVIEAAERRFIDAEAENEKLKNCRNQCKIVCLLEKYNEMEEKMIKEKERAEKAERERDAAISDLTFAVNQYRLFTTDIDLCGLCKFDLPPAGESGQTAECPGFYKDNCFEWRGQKEE